VDNIRYPVKPAVVQSTPPLLQWVSGPAASRNSNLTDPHHYQSKITTLKITTRRVTSRSGKSE
jgi:hypothetical protein